MKSYFLYVLLTISIFMNCSEKKEIKNEFDSPKIVKKYINRDSNLIAYFGRYNKLGNSYDRIDTFYIYKNIVNDSLMSFEYRSLNDTSGQVIGPGLIYIIDENYKPISLSKNYIEEFVIDSVFYKNAKGDSLLLIECSLKNPPIDGAGINIISPEYGLVLSYSHSWNNYYILINTSNDTVSKNISEQQKLYLMSKADLFDIN